MPRGRMSLAQALGDSKGLDVTSANDEKVFVIRGRMVNESAELIMRPIVYQIDMSRLGNLVLAERFELDARDIVYVDRTGTANYNAVVAQFLPTISALFQLDRLVVR